MLAHLLRTVSVGVVLGAVVAGSAIAAPGDSAAPMGPITAPAPIAPAPTAPKAAPQVPTAPAPSAQVAGNATGSDKAVASAHKHKKTKHARKAKHPKKARHHRARRPPRSPLVARSPRPPPAREAGVAGNVAAVADRNDRQRTIATRSVCSRAVASLGSS